MITRTDWDNALDSWVADERERLGGPPSPEEVVAYLSGELPPAEAARVRALLVYYPELTPLLDERIEKPRVLGKPRVLQAYAIAATVTIALLTGVVVRLQEKSDQPAVPSSAHEFHALLARGVRSAVAYELPAGQERYLITAVPIEPPSEPAYEIEITRETAVLWRARGVRPLNDTFVIDIPGGFLTPGTYTLSIKSAGHIVERYRFNVR